MRKTLISVFSLFLCYCANADTILTVEYLDGNEAKEQLAKLSKIVFVNNGTITFDYNNGDTKDFGKVSGTRKIVFAEGEWTKAENDAIGPIVKVYPNPTSNTIKVMGMADGQQVTIYAMNGKGLITSNQSEINVSQLANGQYLVVVGKTVVKLIKK